MKTKSKKYVKRKLDSLWSEIIRSKKYCERCGKPANNAHHVIGRVNLVLRWDVRNGCLLCSNCHYLQKYSAHQDPLGLMEWFRKTRPEDYKYLKEKKNETRTFSILDYRKIYKDLKHVAKETDKR